MNLVDAISSGKDLRRKGWPGWISRHPDGAEQLMFTASDMVAYDWEIKSPEITTTKELAEKAFLEIVKWAISQRGLFYVKEEAHVAFGRALAILGFK